MFYKVLRIVGLDDIKLILTDKIYLVQALYYSRRKVNDGTFCFLNETLLSSYFFPIIVATEKEKNQ